MQVVLASTCLPCISFAIILFIRWTHRPFQSYFSLTAFYYSCSVVWEILIKFAPYASARIAKYLEPPSHLFFDTLYACHPWSSAGFWNEKIFGDSWWSARAVLQVLCYGMLESKLSLSPQVPQRFIWWLQNSVRFFWKGRLHPALIASWMKFTMKTPKRKLHWFFGTTSIFDRQRNTQKKPLNTTPLRSLFDRVQCFRSFA